MKPRLKEPRPWSIFCPVPGVSDRLWTWLAAAFLCGAPSTVSAANPAPASPFRPAASTESYIATESSDVLPAWTPAAQLMWSYGEALRATDVQTLQLQRRAAAQALFGLGLFNWAQLDIALPIVAYQSGSVPDVGGPSPLEVSAIGDLRTGLKGTFLHTPDRGFGLGLAFDVTFPTGRAAALTSAGGMTYSPQLLIQQRMAHGIEAALNVGYSARPDQTFENVVLGDSVTYRAAVRLPFGKFRQVAAVGEMDGAFGIRQGAAHPLVLRGGLRWRLRSGMVLGVYGGGAAVAAFGVPDVHGLICVGYSPPSRVRAERAFDGSPRPSAVALARRHDRAVAMHREPPRRPPNPHDPDGDGILAQNDRCGDVAEDLDGFEDHDGCPEFDDDRDGIPDRQDMCPRQPEIVNGYGDTDGCPDVRWADGGGKSFAEFDPRMILPVIEFEPNASALSAASQAELARLAQLVRLNPWIGRLELEIRVHPTADPARDRALAQARAEGLRETLLARGLDPWRVAVAPPTAVPQERSERVGLALRIDTAGLRPLAPSATEMRLWANQVEQPIATPSDSDVDIMAQGPPESTTPAPASTSASTVTPKE